MTHGGKRPGAGRKRLPPGQKKISYATKLDPLIVRYLRSCKNAAVEIETRIKRTKAFRDWMNR